MLARGVLARSGVRAFVLLCVACSAGTADLPERSGGQLAVDYRLDSDASRLTILVVDDAPTEAAADLRNAVADALRSGLHQTVNEKWGGCGSADPARDHYSDERVLVVLPSAPDVQWIGPSDLPGLAWVTRTSRHDEVEHVAEATRKALSARLAELEDDYLPIQRATRALALVLGRRPPEDAAENALLGSVAPDAYVRVLVASTRDDDGTEPLGHAIDSWNELANSERLFQTSVLGPFGHAGDTCDASSSKSPARLFEWASELCSRTVTWPCPVDHVWQNLFGECCADCAPLCQPGPLIQLPTGGVACRVWTDQRDLQSCDPTKGRRDPDGSPTFVDDLETPHRRCELVQLEGPPRDACRESLACEGCNAGWCATEVPELLDEGCWGGTVPSPFRWVGAALEGVTRLSIRCDLW